MTHITVARPPKLL